MPESLVIGVDDQGPVIEDPDVGQTGLVGRVLQRVRVGSDLVSRGPPVGCRGVGDHTDATDKGAGGGNDASR